MILKKTETRLQAADSAGKAEAMKKDPICNMDVSEETAFTADYNGITCYFCSEGCRDKFLIDRSCKVSRTSYDLIIIGGGPAGLTAAVYAATLRMDAFSHHMRPWRPGDRQHEDRKLYGVLILSRGRNSLKSFVFNLFIPTTLITW